MDVTIYRGYADELFLMPACYLPCVELDHLHVLQKHCGDAKVVAPEHGSRLMARILDDIDTNTFARITMAEGVRLFGAGSPCIERALRG